MNSTDLRISHLALLLGMLLIPYGSYSEAYIIEGKQWITNARANFTQSITLTKKSAATILINRFENYSNSVTRQLISPYQLSIHPNPSKTEDFLDSFGNFVTQITYTYPVKNITVESNFMVSVEMSAFLMDSMYPFPLDALSVKPYTDFLQSTELCPMNDTNIIQKAQQLSLGYGMEYFVVLNILNWVRTRIDYQPSCPFSDAKRTLLNGYGNKQGILHLACTLLRIIGIPTRYVQGVATDRSLFIPGENMMHTIRYPKSLYDWIEVYFPDRDWCSFDLSTSFFIIPPSLIRKSVGLDSPSCSDHVKEVNKQKSISSRFFIEVRKEKTELQVTDEWKEVDGLVIMPPVSNALKMVALKILHPVEGHSVYSMQSRQKTPIELLPFSLNFDSNVEQMEILVTPDVLYAQGFQVPSKVTVQSIDLPLYRYNNEQQGEIWLELMDDQDGKPGKKIAETESISLESLPNKETYFWVTFPMSSKLVLSPNSYWMVFHYNSKEIVLWYGIFGNPFQTYNDTLYLSKENIYWEYMGHFDFCFRINSY